MNDSDAQQQQHQTYYGWIREHFRLDSNDLEEISSCIAVPDVDMPDVLSLLADDFIEPSDAENPPQQPAPVPAGNTTTNQQRRSSIELARSQRQHQQLQADASIFRSFEQHQAAIGKQPAQVPAEQLQLQPSQWQVHQQLAQQQLFAAGVNPLLQTGQELNVALPNMPADVATDINTYQLQSLPPALPTVTTPFDLPVAGLPMLSAALPGTVNNTTPAHVAGLQLPASVQHTTAAAAFGNQPIPTSANSGGTASHHSSDGSGDGPAAGAAAVGGGAVDGVVKRRRRKPSEAQRQAHRRFRQRRKEQMVQLENEVAAKQAQLQALSVEHVALAAKARALDRLVASAGESFCLVQHMQQLSMQSQQVGQQQQQQQQQAQTALQAAERSVVRALTAPESRPIAVAAAASADVSAAAVAGLNNNEANQHLQQQQRSLNDQDAPSAASAAVKLEPGATGSSTEPWRDDMQQLLRLAGLEHKQQQLLQVPECRGGPAPGPKIGSSSSQQQQQQGGHVHCSSTSLGSESGGEGSIEQFEAAMTRMLTVTRDPVALMPANDRARLQGALATLQAIMKSFVAEVMQLVLQIGREGSSTAAPWPFPQPLAELQLLQQQGLGFVGEQQPEQCCPDAFAIATAASPAAVRLQYLLTQVRKEFRKFAAHNRISLYYLHTLNCETGTLGVPVPPGHWRRAAQLLKERLTPGVLADMMVARQLYSNAAARIKQQRQFLLLQLQQVLEQYSNMRQYKSDLVMSNTQGPHGQGVELLDAIDSNLRKEWVFEGVHQWTFHKLVPPILAAELLVHSWPYLPDMHAILEEIEPLQTELKVQELSAVDQQASQWSMPLQPGMLSMAAGLQGQGQH